MLHLDKIEFFNGYIRCNPWFLAIDLLLIIHFIAYWYYTSKKSGWKIDFWHISLFVKFFFPVLIMYPFNGSRLNVFAFGKDFYKLSEVYIDYAFFITIIGYVSIYFGRFIYSKLFPHDFISRLFLPMERLIEYNIKTKLIPDLLRLSYILFLFLVIYIQISTNTFLNPRKYFQGEDSMRPIYNFTLALFPIVIVYTGLNYFTHKTLGNKLALIFLLLSSPFLGTRTVVLEPVIILIGFYSFMNYNKMKMRSLISYGLGVVIVAILLLYSRSGATFKDTMNEFNNEVFYGSTFSDTRDFALILSKWDFNFVEGNTYLAGLISFTPRFLSSFRQEWALSVYTQKYVGFDIKNHPGMRPGSFGEMFFNFSYIGVCLLGILLGYVLRHVDLMIKKGVMIDKDIIKAYAATFSWSIVLCFCISINFASLYVFILINIVLCIIRQAFSNKLKPRLLDA